MREVAANARGPGAGIAFCPMQAAPGAEGRHVIWIIADAAGLRTRAGDTPLPLSDQGGGGAWLVARTDTAAGRQPDPHPVHCRCRPWTTAELAQCSTYLEGLNATETIVVALAGAPDAYIICVLDSASWCYAARKLRCPSPHTGIRGTAAQPARRSRLLRAPSPDRHSGSGRHLQSCYPAGFGRHGPPAGHDPNWTARLRPSHC